MQTAADSHPLKASSRSAVLSPTARGISRAAEPNPIEQRQPTTEPRTARLTIFQAPRNPSERQRRILTLIAEGHTQRETATLLGVRPRCVTAALGNMRERYTAPTNEALVALAVRLQWIALTIDCDPLGTVPTEA